VRELELEAIEELGGFVGCRGCTGYITSGGSESNLAALYLARELMRRTSPREGRQGAWPQAAGRA
jgi:hypothetical protein